MPDQAPTSTYVKWKRSVNQTWTGASSSRWSMLQLQQFIFIQAMPDQAPTSTYFKWKRSSISLAKNPTTSHEMTDVWWWWWPIEDSDWWMMMADGECWLLVVENLKPFVRVHVGNAVLPLKALRGSRGSALFDVSCSYQKLLFWRISGILFYGPHRYCY